MVLSNPTFIKCGLYKHLTPRMCLTHLLSVHLVILVLTCRLAMEICGQFLYSLILKTCTLTLRKNVQCFLGRILCELQYLTLQCIRKMVVICLYAITMHIYVCHLSVHNIQIFCEHTRGRTVHPLHQSRITQHLQVL